MKREKAKRYYLTKMLTSYILIVFVLLTCAFSSFFYFTIRSKTNEIEKSAQKAMEQISFSAKILYDQVSQVGAGLLGDLSVELFFSRPTSEPAFEYSLYNKMRTLRINYPYIHSILLYRQESQNLLSDVYGNTLSGEPAFLQTVDQVIADHANFSQIELPVLSTSESKKEDDVLAFFYYPFRNSSSQSSCAIIVFVEEDYFLELISSISLNPINQIILLDNDGNLILSTKENHITESWDPAFFQKNILSSSKTSGQVRQKLNEKNYNISFTKTDTLHWTFLSLSDPENDLVSLQQTLILLSFISFFLLIFGIMTTVLVTRQMYSPVKSLLKQALHIVPPSSRASCINEYDLIQRSLSTLSAYSLDLENQFQIAKPFFQEALIQKILTKTYTKKEWELIKQLEIYHFPFHCVILAKLDRSFLFSGDSGVQSKNLLTYAIENMLHEVLAADGKSVFILKKPGELILLVSYERKAQAKSFEKDIQRVQKIFAENFLQSFTVAIGPEKKFAEIYQSLELATSYFSYRFSLGNSAFISDPALQRLSSSTKLNLSTESIFAKLRMEQDFQEDLDTLFSALTRIPPAAALAEIKTFLFRLQNEMPSEDLVRARKDPYFVLLLDSPEKLENLQNIFDQLNRLSEWLQIRWIQKTANKNREIIDAIKQYILQHYPEPELSTEQISEKMALSPRYLSKLFRASEGMGISEFVMVTRLNAARDLLLSTTLTASAICEKIGIYSNTYFSTLFKKRFGTTPILYRQSFLNTQANLDCEGPDP